MSGFTPMVVVHGGAGRWPTERHELARRGVEAAVSAGLEVLARGGAAVDAVVAAVTVLEEDPAFNAGVGSVLTRRGTVETDASVMDGTTLRFGAVAAMSNARNPVAIARAIMDMEDGEQALLCADGAWELARQCGFSPSMAEDLITEWSRTRLADEAARRSMAEGAVVPVDPGTVGACAFDAAGQVAAATSTGGKSYKRPGRIGDTPICGAGTYANHRGGAASATGDGERIMRVTMTRSCVDHMRSGAGAHQAAWRAVDELWGDVGGEGGIICCDRLGRAGAAHNSQYMPFGAGVLPAGRDTPRLLFAMSAQRELDLLSEL